MQKLRFWSRNTEGQCCSVFITFMQLEVYSTALQCRSVCVSSALQGCPVYFTLAQQCRNVWFDLADFWLMGKSADLWADYCTTDCSGFCTRLRQIYGEIFHDDPMLHYPSVRWPVLHFSLCLWLVGCVSCQVKEGIWLDHVTRQWQSEYVL